MDEGGVNSLILRYFLIPICLDGIFSSDACWCDGSEWFLMMCYKILDGSLINCSLFICK